MKILIITQKVDKHDDVLGFFHRWLEVFSVAFEKVTVIALYRGAVDLPNNVTVLSLGKEEGESKVKYLSRFYASIWKARREYDIVLVHMNPEYVLLGFWLWKLLGKKITLWYAHKQVNAKLWIAEKLVNKIFTPSKDSFRLKSKKVQITGHGIDTEHFKPLSLRPKGLPRIVTIGRISPIKNYETIIDAVGMLSKEHIPVSLQIVGSPATLRDVAYQHRLEEKVKAEDLSPLITFAGSVPHEAILPFLQNATVFVNTSSTGSLDKAVLEAMSVGILPLTSNEAFKEVFGAQAEHRMFEAGNARSLAEKIKKDLNLSPEMSKMLSDEMRTTVIKHHNLQTLIKTLRSSYENLLHR
jgi:glycosyltransferase involved in cell wall biosynthesis